MMQTAMDYRRAECDAAASLLFDVVVVGAGITGACLFHHLRSKGFRVLLIDKSDFAAGTSQASAMMLWGGILYMRSLDFRTVYRLSSSRDELIGTMQNTVRPRAIRYVVPTPRTGNRLAVQSAMLLYWFMGRCRRSRPKLLEYFQEQSLLNTPQDRHCFEFEEGYLLESDARFVIEWIVNGRGLDNPALNYCSLTGGQFEPATQRWRLMMNDCITNREIEVQAKLVVNAAGVWTDGINRQFGIETTHKHILSKGVFIGLPRHPLQDSQLVLAGKGERDCFSLIPWGPISLWGPTETLTSSTSEGFSVTGSDVGILLEEYHRHFTTPLAREDIVSLRCGVRGLAVSRHTQNVPHTLNLSRKHVVERNAERPWISILGGKLTGCVPLARSVVDVVQQRLRPSGVPSKPAGHAIRQPIEVSFPGLTSRVLSPEYCARESCWTLEDYLRRRTNIAQWVPRGGLGLKDENASHLERWAGVFSTRYGSARGEVDAYRSKVEREFEIIR